MPADVSADFEPRQILVTRDGEPTHVFIVHEGIWAFMEAFAERHRLRLARLPDGADEQGVAFFREQRPDTMCEQCGHTPTYAFMPK